MNILLSHFHSWERFTAWELPELFADFARHGLQQLSLNSDTSAWIADFPSYADLLRRESAHAGLSFVNAHAPHAPGWELNSADSSPLERHRTLLDHFAALGCDTVTIHVGTNDSGESLVRLRERTNRSIAALLPRAQDLGLTLVLENTIFPTDTPEELLGYAKRFRCDAFGFCFDAGHANLMDVAVNKRSSDMVEWIVRRWDGNVCFATDTLGALLPDIVTCHLHDNDGLDDQHKLPGAGTINWPHLFNRLADAPRLRSLQNETNHFKYVISAAEIATHFNRLISVTPVSVAI